MNERRRDSEGLQRFARQGDQSSFAEVVRQHMDVVFGTAFRTVEDYAAAQEVAPNVFLVLAEKAWRFAPRRFSPRLAAEVDVVRIQHLVAPRTAAPSPRGNRRRIGHDHDTSEAQPALAVLLPLLDQALLSLREHDRTARLWRFYETQSLREVGATFGFTEDTARKRAQPGARGPWVIPAGAGQGFSRSWLPGVQMIAGVHHSVALRADGTLWRTG